MLSCNIALHKLLISVWVGGAGLSDTTACAFPGAAGFSPWHCGQDPGAAVGNSAMESQA